MKPSFSSSDYVKSSQIALDLLSAGSLSSAEDIFQRLLSSFPSSITPSMQEVSVLNNLSFISHKKGDSYHSLSLLTRALAFKARSDSELEFTIGTLVNLSAVNLSLGFHQIAMQQAFLALEHSVKVSNAEVKALCNYNLASQFAISERPDKASGFYREALGVVSGAIGSGKVMAALAVKANSLCLSTSRFIIRAKHSAHTSGSISFSINQSRASKYPENLSTTEQKHTKISLSSKIATTGRTLALNLALMRAPYTKDVRISKKLHSSEFKFFKEKLWKSRTTMRADSTPISRSLKSRLASIRNKIQYLESHLKEFSLNSRRLSPFAFAPLDPSTSWAAIRIQRWLRSLPINKI